MTNDLATSITSDAATLSLEEVRHLAQLARIALTEEELPVYQQQLSEVIDYNIKLLAEVEVTNVEPTAQTTGLTNVWQEDQPRPSLPLEIVLLNAPVQAEGYFAVKKVLGEVDG